MSHALLQNHVLLALQSVFHSSLDGFAWMRAFTFSRVAYRHSYSSDKVGVGVVMFGNEQRLYSDNEKVILCSESLQ